MSIQVGQTLDRDTLNRAYVSKSATGTQIMAGSLRLLGGIQIDGTTTLGSVTTGALTLTGALSAGANAITTTGTITAGTFSGSGASLTTLNATNLSSGTVADARLSTNVLLLASAQTVTANKTFSSAANLYFAGGTTYYVNTAGTASLNAASLAGNLTMLGTKYLEFSQAGVAAPGDSSAGTKIKLYNDGYYNIGIEAASIWHDANTYHRFYTNGGTSTRTERARVDTSGLVVTGTTTTTNLDVQGEIKAGINNEFPDPLLISKNISLWSANKSSTATVAYDIQAPIGTGVAGSLKISATATDAWAFYDYKFDVNPNEWITWSTYAFATVSGVATQLYIHWMDASSATISYSTLSTANTATSWTRYQVTGQAPSTARYFKVRVDNDGGAGTIAYFSAFQVERGRAMTGFKPYTGGSTASFFDKGMKLGSGGEIHSGYNNKFIIKDKADGNVTINAAGAVLYVGAAETTSVQIGATLTDSDGTTVVDTVGKLYYQGNDIDGRYVKLTGSTMTGNLTMNTNNIYGSNANNYLNLSAAPVLSSVSSITIQADSDDSSTTEYLSLKAGSDELKVTSGGSITFNTNKVWHAGNDGTGSGLDADTIDGLDSLAFMRATSDGTYYGMTEPGGGTAQWIRTTTSGLIPAASGGASSSLGTSSWNFSTIYGKTIYENNVSLASKYLGLTDKAADSEKLDGIDSTGFVQTSRTVNAGTGISGGGDLTTDRTLSFDTTWGDSRYLGKTATAADSSKLGGIAASTYVRTDTDNTINANLIINSSSDSRYLYITRTGVTTDEYVRHGVTDNMYDVFYSNDEASSSIKWTIENKDTELPGTGVYANTTVLELSGSISPTLKLNNNLIWHAGNDGTGSGLDADTVDGVELAGLVQTSRTLTGGTGITIDTVTNAATNLTADRTIAFDTTWGDNRYLGKTAKAVDADKLDGIDSASFVRNDSATTMTVGLLFSSTATAGPTSASPTALSYGKLQSYGTFTIAADTDGSTTEFLNLAAGYASPAAADGLSIGNTTLKWKDNTVWHAGNDGTGSGLDADKLDGIDSTGFALSKLLGNSVDANTVITSGFYRIGTTPVNTPASMSYGQLIVVHGGTDTILQMAAPYNADNLYFRSGNPTDVGGTGSYRAWSKIWNDNNDGTGSGLDADLLDGLQGSDYLRSNTNSTFTGTLAVNGKLDASGDIESDGLLYLTNIPMSNHREGGKMNYLSRVPGRLLNKNSDFIVGTMAGYTLYDNNNSGRLTASIITDDVAPNATGKVLRMDYNPARNAGTLASPDNGGFKIAFGRGTGMLSDWKYRAGNRYVYRIIAKIPTSRSLIFYSNDTGTGTTNMPNFKWLTPTAGTGNWQEYIAIQTIQETETVDDAFSTTGYFTVNGTATTAFTWDVSICQIIGIDEIPDVDRAPSLNVGYKTGVDIGWGELYSTGKITTDSTITASGSITGVGITSTNGLTISSGSLSITNGLITNTMVNAGMELGSTTTANTPFIDFHSSGGTEDHTARIIASGGTAGTVGSGTLTLTAANTVATGMLTINKVSNVSTITFPAGTGGNDPAYIKHIETTADVGIMQFSASDGNANDNDYFSFGATPSSTYTEGAKISTAGNAWFKSTNVTALTSSGMINAPWKDSTTYQLQIGSVGFNTVNGNNGDLVMRGLNQLRFGSSGNWAWNDWAGIKFDSTIKKLYIGGPASAIFSDDGTSVPKIDLSFEGTTTSAFDGKVIITDGAATNINGTTIANGWLQIGTGLALDPDEIMFSAASSITTAAGTITLKPNNTSVLSVANTGVSVTGTLSASSTASITGSTTSGKAKIGTSSSYSTYAYFGNKLFDTASGYALMQEDTGITILNAETGQDLIFRIGNSDKMRILGSNGKVGIGTTAPSYPLHVVGDVYATSWLRSGGATGWYNETYAGGWYMTDATWVKSYNSKSVYINNIMRSSSLEVGSGTTYTAANDFQVSSAGILNHRNTLWANNVGVAVGKTSLSNAAVLDVYTTSAAGINLQRSAETNAPGISFQNSGAAGNYTAWIAPTASATADLAIYTKGTSATLSTANIQETIRFKNDGNTELKGDLIFNGSGTQKIRKVNEISFDWTGAFDNAANHGIQSHTEDGTQSDSLRINSYANIIMTIDTNANSTSYFKVQKESTADGTDLLTIDESGNGILTGTLQVKGNSIQFNDNNGTNIIYTDSNVMTQAGFYDTADGFDFKSDGSYNDTVVKAGNFHATETVYSDGGMGTGKFKMVYNTTEDSLDFTYVG